MSIETRSKSLNFIKSSSDFDSVNSLILKKNLRNTPSYFKFKDAAFAYISNSLSILNKSNFLNEIFDNYNSYTNITPNGSLAPKIEFEKEYNHMISCYVDLLDSLNLSCNITEHHFPIHIRIKKFSSPNGKSSRPHATELIHSDAWAGESSDAVNLHIPLFGDIENNHMKFFMPPSSFNTNWLVHLPNYLDGADIANLYEPVELSYGLDTAIISDLATLHQTNINPKANIRISLDTTFLNLKDSSHNEPVFIHPNRKSEMLNFDFFKTLGKTNLIKLSNSLHSPIDNGKIFSIGLNWNTNNPNDA